METKERGRLRMDDGRGVSVGQSIASGELASKGLNERGKETRREQSDTRNPILPAQHFDRLLVQTRRRLCASVRYGQRLLWLMTHSPCSGPFHLQTGDCGTNSPRGPTSDAMDATISDRGRGGNGQGRKEGR